ncbi:YceI family protein [Candidatus Uhrbacteria bacterium]|nr:YceI family protein [Candidatus Uhrbacteria bacterium]
MFKQLFPVLLVPMILLGAGCATAQNETQVNTQETEEDESVVMVDIFTDGSYILQAEQSSVSWQAQKRVGASHNGTVQAQEGALVVQQGGVIGGSIVADMNTIADLDLTDEKFNTMLVTHLKSEDFFSVDTYPTASFAISNVEALNGLEGFSHRVDGTMTIKGIENDISFPANLTKTEEGIKIVGTMTLDRTLWDVRYGSDTFFENLGDGLVEDEFQLSFDMFFAQAE